MISTRRLIFSFLAFILLGVNQTAIAQEGKDKVGKLSVKLYFGTDGDVALAGEKAQDVPAQVKQLFLQSKHLRFSQYKLLGVDTPPIFRSYENWAAPLRPSEEILLSFEPRDKPGDGNIHLDLEFWQSKKKVMKASQNLHLGKPIFILGPVWRGGRLIIAVELVSLKK